MLAAIRRVFDRWPGVWTGVVVGTLGLALMAVAYAIQVHASDGTIVAAGERYEFRGLGPVYVAGVLTPGDDATEPATCTVSYVGRTDTIPVGSRSDRFDTIPAGQRLSTSPPVTLQCDRRVAVSSGPAVIAYPLAASRSLTTGYGMLAVLGVGFTIFELLRRRRAVQTSLASAPSRSPPDDATPGGAHVRPGVAALFVLASVGTFAVLAASIFGWPSMAVLVTPVLFAAAGVATLLTIAWSKTA